MDTSSADPGSTAGGGKPDLPNVGFVVQGNQRDLDANYALLRLRPAASFQRQLRVGAAWRGVVAARLPCLGLRATAVRPALLNLRRRARAREHVTVRRSRPRIGRHSIAWVSAVRACAAPWMSSVSHGDDPTEAAFNKARAVLADDICRRIPGQSGLRQSRSQRAAWILAASRRSQPGQERSRSVAMQTVRGAVGRLQRVQHRQLRASEQRHWRGNHGFRQNHGFGGRTARDAAGRPAEVLSRRGWRSAREPGAIRSSRRSPLRWRPSFSATIFAMRMPCTVGRLERSRERSWRRRVAVPKTHEERRCGWQPKRWRLRSRE